MEAESTPAIQGPRWTAVAGLNTIPLTRHCTVREMTIWSAWANLRRRGTRFSRVWMAYCWWMLVARHCCRQVNPYGMTI